MWLYEKKLQYPVRIKKPNPQMAMYILSQFGGPDGELAASLRYLSQRHHMPIPEAKAMLNDIGTEELAHFEMIGAMVHQLMKNASLEQIKAAGAGTWYTDHDRATWPGTGTGVPFTASYIMSKGDPIADLYEDLAAEQKARATYEHLIDLADDPDVIDPLRWLREREVVHFQRFGEILMKLQEHRDRKHVF
ncbi:MAG TPA: manganese catalase family protein [Candidatus Atribacteria bacterium]|nr:manganese catalase family protein [Candidatus Atribacteria bacterium]HPT78352.1 manganese catalase family protein [Candidatus Atribacteria bacterium]